MNDGRLFAMSLPDGADGPAAGDTGTAGAGDLISAAAGDRSHGASTVALYAAEGLGRLASELPEPADFAPAFLRAARTLLVNQVALGPIWTLVNECLLSADAAEGPEFAADAVVDACKSFRTRLGRARKAITRELTSLVPEGADILTTSASATLESALAAMSATGHVHTIYCTRSLPGGEGADLARRLRDRQIRAHVVEDSAVTHAIEASDFVVLGADAIAGDWVVNKVGSRPLALCAFELGLPAVVAADTFKMIPYPITEAVEGHIETDPQTARFEVVPWRELDGWVSETGYLDARSVEIITSTSDLHPRTSDLAHDLIASLRVHTGYTDPSALTREQLDRALALADPERPLEDLLRDDLVGGLDAGPEGGAGGG